MLPRCLAGCAAKPGDFIFWQPQPLTKQSSPSAWSGGFLVKTSAAKPAAKVPFRTVALLASRQGRLGPDKRPFLDAVRNALLALDPNRDSVLTAAKLTTHDLVAAAAPILGISVIELVPIPERANRAWFRRQARLRQRPSWDRIYYRHSGTPRLGSRDEIVATCAHQILGIAVRPNGNVSTALQKRLREGNCQGTAVRILVDSRLTPDFSNQELQRLGAIPTYQKMSPESALISRANDTSTALVRPYAPSGEPFLFHWTRPTSLPSKSGRGLGSDRLMPMRRLLFQTESDPAGCIAALISIVAETRLTASSRLTRGRFPVVSFTANPLNEWVKLRRFRCHLSRWDFVPFGIAILQAALVPHGVKPVIYGDDASWAKLPRADRPFFQVATSGRGKTQVDWRTEKEWRIVGDLDLKRFRSDQLFVFVEDELSARLVQPYSRWPVYFLNPIRPATSITD